MRILVALVLVTAAAGPVAGPTEAAGPEVRTEEQKIMYALGLAISNSLANFRLSETELELVKAGIADGVLGKERKVDLQTYGPKLQELQKTRLAAAAEGEKKAGQAVLAMAAAEKGAVKTASGMIVVPIKPGTGPAPKASDKVKVHYHGTLADGTQRLGIVDGRIRVRGLCAITLAPRVHRGAGFFALRRCRVGDGGGAQRSGEVRLGGLAAGGRQRQQHGQYGGTAVLRRVGRVRKRVG